MKKLFLIILCMVVCLSLCACDNPEARDNPYEVGKTITYGRYEQDNDLNNGSEPIEWIVLDEQEDKVLLLSKNILDYQIFSNSGEDSWATSYLKFWCSNFTVDFSEEEKSKIISSNETADRIFVLSTEELQKYLLTDEERKAFPTKYAAEKGAGASPAENIMVGSPDKPASYWTRTQAEDGSSRIFFVRDDGSFSNFSISRYEDGVRPAMWIKIQ